MERVLVSFQNALFRINISCTETSPRIQDYYTVIGLRSKRNKKWWKVWKSAFLFRRSRLLSDVLPALFSFVNGCHVLKDSSTYMDHSLKWNAAVRTTSLIENNDSQNISVSFILVVNTRMDLGLKKKKKRSKCHRILEVVYEIWKHVFYMHRSDISDRVFGATNEVKSCSFGPHRKTNVKYIFGLRTGQR